MMSTDSCDGDILVRISLVANINVVVAISCKVKIICVRSVQVLLPLTSFSRSA